MMDLLKTTTLTVISLSIGTGGPLPCHGQNIDDASVFRLFNKEITEPAPEPDTVSFVFLGDIMLHSAQIANASEKFTGPDRSDTTGHYSFDFSQYFSDIQEYISAADLAVANMEFTLGGPPFTGYPAFSAPDGYARYMAECGIDVFLTANNHILDKGAQGAVRTLNVYTGLKEEFGTRYTGTGTGPVEFSETNPLIVDIGGLKAALVNFTYGTNAYVHEEYPRVNRTDKGQLLRQFRKAEESRADIIIALPHWGEEYSLLHSAHQYLMAEWLAENGADIIIGTHPHVVQDSTVITVRRGQFSGKKVPVIFSLGNAISNMSARDTQTGLLAKVCAVKHLNGKVEIFPIEFTYLWCSLPGRLKDTHCTIPVKKYLSRPGMWRMLYEYDKMLDSYTRVKTATGIKDQ